ncbi:unnamed protein product, partial [Ixodes persulcatus]
FDSAQFKYSSFKDRSFTAVGCVVAVVTGFAMPTLIILMGQLLRKFIIFHSVIDQLCSNSTLTIEQFQLDAKLISGHMALVGLAMLLSNVVIVGSLGMSATKQSFRIRHNFMRAMLHQEVGWFDTHTAGDFARRITADLGNIHDGLGENIGMCLFFLSTASTSLVSAFWHGWHLTLALLAMLPLLVLVTALIAKIQAKLEAKESVAYQDAGTVAEEAVSFIKNVIAYGGERKEMKRHRTGLKRGLVTSVGVSIIWACIYASYSLGFWYGVSLIVVDFDTAPARRTYDTSTLIVVFFSVMMCAMSLGQATPYFQAFTMAKCAAGKVYEIIDRKPAINSSSSAGLKPESLEGAIEFSSVTFCYPSRATVPALENFCLSMDPGETVALVGKRGCGKTTIVNLLQRFYDVTEGRILLDHRNIRSYNVGWLRGQMGVVGQDPVLFQATVAQNIRYGLATATQFDIEQSAITANAHQFILKLPRKYDTVVGEHGYRLTSSQVQRIAIARALVRNPRIFLMDDAPPVASIEVDADLKGALEKARRGRTALIVAQRLSTIRCADKILVMRSGKVVDFGTHNELIKRASGAYLELLTTQVRTAHDLLRISFSRRHTATALLLVVTVPQLIGSSVPLLAPTQRVSGDKRPDSPLNSAQNTAKSLRTKLLRLTDPERGYMTAGCLCALLMGLSVPVYAIFLGDMLQASELSSGLGSGNADLIMSTTIFYCLLFLMVGVLTGFCSFLQTFSFSVVGENLTRRLRKITFSAMMRQEVAWYDEEDHTPERLCTFLFSDTARVHGGTCSKLPSICQALSALVACLVMSFYWDWHLGFIVLAFVPLVLLSTYLESRMLRGKLMSSKQALDNSTRIAVEAIQNIRTVASLHQEEVFCANYVQSLTEPQRIMKRKAILRGFSFGVAQCIPSMAYATSLLYGSILVGRCDLLFGNLFKVVEGVILGTAMIGQAVAYSPDYHKAKAAAQRIFRLIDRVPKIDFMDKSGITMQSIRGFLTFNEVSFHYPHHPEVRALDHVTFSVEPGQTVALVGPNYSGKSTSVHLVERFYDITEGEILIDHIGTKMMRLSWMRAQLGYVSSETLLHSYSVADNIGYGDNSREVSRDEVILAAQKANAHDFIVSLPEVLSSYKHVK